MFGIEEQEDLESPDIELQIIVNFRAETEADKYYISLKELHGKVGYKRDFSSWAKETLMRRGVHARKLKRRNGEAGRPVVDYYVNLNDFGPIKTMVQNYKHLRIGYIQPAETSFRATDRDVAAEGEQYEE